MELSDSRLRRKKPATGAYFSWWRFLFSDGGEVFRGVGDTLG